MSRLSFEALEKAVSSIEEGLMEYQQYPHLLSIRDGIIQRFEIAMDLAWKLIQRVLKEVHQVDFNNLRTKKDLFREAATYQLITNVDHWFMHYEARSNTSHTYDEKIAAQVFADIPVFLSDVDELIKRLHNVA
jgi:nucleotidyltransferase substrate binding protein (TIGR01987 family)